MSNRLQKNYPMPVKLQRKLDQLVSKSFGKLFWSSAGLMSLFLLLFAASRDELSAVDVFLFIIISPMLVGILFGILAILESVWLQLLKPLTNKLFKSSKES